MRVDLGEKITQGDEIARIWALDHTGFAPDIIKSTHTGILAARHFPGLIKTGDCLAVVASVVENS